MIKLAWRNLMHEQARLVISTGGVALAVLLILVMSGVFAGSEKHAVAYIKNQPAPLWMMQEGVENLHMASSILPPETVAKVKSVDGVQEAVGLLYTNAGMEIAGEVVYSYIFAVNANDPFGGPWELVAGTKSPAADEVVIDRDLAARYGLELGDSVTVFGHDLKIAGLSAETFGIATSITFVNKEALAAILGVSPQAASYILIQPDSGVDSKTLKDFLRAEVPEVNLMTQADFMDSDQEMIRQMGADIIRAMNSVAYVVGLLVIGLTIYTATLERAQEYGVLKAIGARMSDLVGLVFIQAYISAALGFMTGILLAYAVAAVIGRIFPEMLILIQPQNILAQLPVLIVITALASLLPLSRIKRLDPMLVFKT